MFLNYFLFSRRTSVRKLVVLQVEWARTVRVISSVANRATALRFLYAANQPLNNILHLITQLSHSHIEYRKATWCIFIDFGHGTLLSNWWSYLGWWINSRERCSPCRKRVGRIDSLQHKQNSSDPRLLDIFVSRYTCFHIQRKFC